MNRIINKKKMSIEHCNLRNLISDIIYQTPLVYCDYVRYLRAPTELQWRCWRPYRAATATTLRFYCGFIRTQNQSAFYAAQSTCQRMAFLVTLRRKIKMHPYFFSWTQKNHLKDATPVCPGLNMYTTYIQTSLGVILTQF